MRLIGKTSALAVLTACLVLAGAMPSIAQQVGQPGPFADGDPLPAFAPPPPPGLTDTAPSERSAPESEGETLLRRLFGPDEGTGPATPSTAQSTVEGTGLPPASPAPAFPSAGQSAPQTAVSSDTPAPAFPAPNTDAVAPAFADTPAPAFADPPAPGFAEDPAPAFVTLPDPTPTPPQAGDAGFFSPVGEAAPPVLAIQPRPSARGGGTALLPLTQWQGERFDIVLNGEQDEERYTVRLQPDMVATRARLIVTYMNSIELMPDGSFMTAWVNDVPVAQAPLLAFDAPLQVQIEFPAELLAPGNNEIAFTVDQVHRIACTIDTTYELWTRIDPEQTYLEIDTQPSTAIPTLATLDRAMASTRDVDEPLAIMMPGGVVTPAQLSWGAAVAQGYALRIGDDAPIVEAIEAPRLPQSAIAAGAELMFPGLDQRSFQHRRGVLVGTRDQLQGIIGEPIRSAIQRAFIGVYPLEIDRTRYVVVISGLDDVEVSQAAQVFAEPGQALPSRSGILVRDIGPPLPTEEGPPILIQQERTYRLSDLGYETRLFGGLRQEIHIPVRMPSDLFVGDDSVIEIRVNAAYAPNLGPGAIINFFANNEIGAAYRLNNPDGEIVEDRLINMPMRLFRPGDNHLMVEVKLPPGPGVVTCPGSPNIPPEDRIRFTLFDDTTFSFPGLPRLATLPDLRTTALTGFPYYRDRQPTPFDFYVTDRSSETVSAAWIAIGKIAQAAGEALRAQGRFRFPENADRDMLIVGPIGQLPSAIVTAAPEGLSEMQSAWQARPPVDPDVASNEQVSASERTDEVLRQIDALRQGVGTQTVRTIDPTYTVPNVGTNVDARAAWEDRIADQDPAPQNDGSEQGTGGIFDLVVDWVVDVAQISRDATANESVIGPNGQAATMAVAQFESRETEGTTWTVLTSPDTELLLAGTRRLADPAFWSQLSGDLTAVGTSLEAVRAHFPERRYYVQTHEFDVRNLRMLAANWFSQNQLQWTIFIVFLLCVFGWVTTRIVQRLGAQPSD